MANFPFPQSRDSIKSPLRGGELLPLPYWFQMQCHSFRGFESLKARVRWIKPRAEKLKREGKKDNNWIAQFTFRHLPYNRYCYLTPPPSSFPLALWKQIGLPHQLEGCLWNSIPVRWYDECVGTNWGNEWLRPRRNGSDMTHHHIPVSFRHSAVASGRIESARGIHRFVHARLLPLCVRSPRKGGHSSSELADTKNRGLYLSATNKARCFDTNATLRKQPGTSFLQRSHEGDSVLKTIDCRLTSRELWINCTLFRKSLATQTTWRYRHAETCDKS